MSKKPVPGMGNFAVCRNTENNSFPIWETDSTVSETANQESVKIV
jgi:hypothetical protein